MLNVILHKTYAYCNTLNDKELKKTKKNLYYYMDCYYKLRVINKQFTFNMLKNN